MENLGKETVNMGRTASVVRFTVSYLNTVAKYTSRD
jgi:hypothetical protein